MPKITLNIIYSNLSELLLSKNFPFVSELKFEMRIACIKTFRKIMNTKNNISYLKLFWNKIFIIKNLCLNISTIPIECTQMKKKNEHLYNSSYKLMLYQKHIIVNIKNDFFLLSIVSIIDLVFELLQFGL
ncbi:hypothetical protein RFI_26625 [Reticulomyxa filosa]|uniref:Uncharacterized protein n=1 Tax=Reticulomyxa filosa TaxID=46433 RepID=X6MBA5_RETFI|nr:hypothetical protein RFI_26625 [Reticulomyxa filosa]|eukprot:ETO10752.1 hypothetical protein RFI_26625 [Reticulomyxa filosa]